MKAQNSIKIFLLCVVIGLGPWLIIYFFYRETMDEMIYISRNSNLSYLVGGIVFAVITFLKIKNWKAFSFWEYAIALIIAFFSVYGSSALGHALFTKIIDDELWHGEGITLQYTPEYEESSTDSDGNTECTSYGPYYDLITNMNGKGGPILISLREKEFKNILRYWYGNQYIGSGLFGSIKTKTWRKTETVGDIFCDQEYIRVLDGPKDTSKRIPVTIVQKFVNYQRVSRSVIGKGVAEKKFISEIPSHHTITPHPKGFGNFDVDLTLFDKKMEAKPELKAWADSVNILLRRALMDEGPKIKGNPFLFITNKGIEIEGTAKAQWGQLKKNDIGILLSVPKSDLSLDMYSVMTYSRNQEFIARLEMDLRDYAVRRKLPPAEEFVAMFMHNLTAKGKAGYDRLHDEDTRHLLKDIWLPIWKRILISIICLIFMTPILLFFHYN